MPREPPPLRRTIVVCTRVRYTRRGNNIRRPTLCLTVYPASVVRVRALSKSLRPRRRFSNLPRLQRGDARGWPEKGFRPDYYDNMITSTTSYSSARSVITGRIPEKERGMERLRRLRTPLPCTLRLSNTRPIRMCGRKILLNYRNGCG